MFLKIFVNKNGIKSATPLKILSFEEKIFSKKKRKFFLEFCIWEGTSLPKVEFKKKPGLVTRIVAFYVIMASWHWTMCSLNYDLPNFKRKKIKAITHLHFEVVWDWL